jgi:isopentenyl diphosphate isomerase/L-lactate dehydrogenase-like FMN-dependent dehydrogenase
MTAPGPSAAPAAEISAADDCITTTELILKAHARSEAATWGYVSGGSESETAKRRNRAAIDAWAFVPRVLRNVSRIDLSAQILKTRLRMPVLLAPVGSLQVVGEGGAASSIGAADVFGVLPVISSSSQPPIEDCAKAAQCDKWYQLYIRGDWDWVKTMVGRIRTSSYRALVLTVDAPVYSVRDRQLHHRWLPPSKKAVHDDDFQALMDWDFVARVKEFAGIPIALKGIQCAADAEIALKRGVDVIWVSNHGGRHLDHARPTLDVLREVAPVVGGRVPIVVDGGFMRGSDFIKAIAFGATAVAVGRMQAYALAAAGAAGIRRYLEIVEEEMQTSMAMIGVTSLAELNPGYLKRLGRAGTAPRPFPLLPEDINI